MSCDRCADLEQMISAQESEIADLKDKLLRALAEAENIRRRAERDRKAMIQRVVRALEGD